MSIRSLVKTSLALALGMLGLGGTCSEPPPWHDVSGTWVNATWGAGGADRTVTLSRGAAGEQVVDLDVAMSITSTVPKDRTPLPVQGTVCVTESAGLGLAGTYLIDAADSTWGGSDYGGARLDIEARASDGRRVVIAQGFMHNASPAELDNAIISFTAANGNALGTVSFEDFARSAAASCP